MINKSEGLIVFKKKIKDNDIFIKILTSNDDIMSGMVYGGNSSKKILTYQVGYFIDFTISRKNTNAPTNPVREQHQLQVTNNSSDEKEPKGIGSNVLIL